MPSARHLLDTTLLALTVTVLTVWGLQLGSVRPPPSGLVTVPAASTGPAAVASMAGAAGLFGAAAPAQSARVSLSGVLGEGRSGVALLSVDGQPAASFRAGDPVAPGIVLESVSVQGAVLLRAGRQETLALPPLPRAPGIEAVEGR